MSEVLLRHNKLIRSLASILLVIMIATIFSFFQLLSNIRGDSAIINEMGRIRGNSQRLVKRELASQYSDDLMNMIDKIIFDVHNDTTHIALRKDQNFQRGFIKLEDSWELLKESIFEARKSGQTTLLYERSENFFVDADQAVKYSQEFVEHKIETILSFRYVLMIAVLPMLIIYIVLVVYSHRFSNRYDQIRNMAYIDSMTGLYNRNHFNMMLSEYHKMSQLPELTCIFFDLNNLKCTNDTFGHDAGNQLLEQFSLIILDVCKEYGKTFRYGGDEFIALLKPSSKWTAANLIAMIETKVEQWNQINDTIQISFAYGITNVKEDKITNIDDLISMADSRMYDAKVKMKKNQLV